jgi:hypothetical protein
MTHRPPPLVAAPLVDFGPALAGCEKASFGVDGQGVAYAVAQQGDETRVLCAAAGAPVTTLLRHAGRLAYQFVQPLDDGVLLAAARCRWPKSGAEPNAVALDGRGRVRAHFTLGDGIADVRVTPDGTIWVSYYDEGVFGNDGWSPSAPGPQDGLAAFTARGEPRFAYRPAAAGTDAICDCYALNVSGDDDVWLYFYDEFPIVRIHNGRYHVWHTHVAGAAALAVRGKRALLLGDYERRDRGRVLELGPKGSASVAATRLLVDEAGAPLAPERACGVGANLYCFSRQKVSVVSEW